MRKVVIRTLIGIICAYAAYIPVLFLVEYAVYGRVDSERAFYALYFAFGAPFLLMPSARQYVRLDEVILNCVGAILFSTAIILSNFPRVCSFFHKQES
jgi:hypothetical protein